MKSVKEKQKEQQSAREEIKRNLKIHEEKERERKEREKFEKRALKKLNQLNQLNQKIW
ncbi:MAG: hypothetical protein PHX04_06275 [Bacilli bacterium]|nr:hypothetical protein [Bacilli bacterium]